MFPSDILKSGIACKTGGSFAGVTSIAKKSSAVPPLPSSTLTMQVAKPFQSFTEFKINSLPLISQFTSKVCSSTIENVKLSLLRSETRVERSTTCVTEPKSSGRVVSFIQVAQVGGLLLVIIDEVTFTII